MFSRNSLLEGGPSLASNIRSPVDDLNITLDVITIGQIGNYFALQTRWNWIDSDIGWISSNTSDVKSPNFYTNWQLCTSSEVAVCRAERNGTGRQIYYRYRGWASILYEVCRKSWARAGSDERESS